MRHRLLKIVGYGFVGLVFAGLALRVLLAVSANAPFLGTNAYLVSIPTYPALAILAVAVVAAVIWLVRRVRNGWRKPR